ncbi:MAG TPA: transglutaminase family protein [Rhizomicrobium sp.]|nr:transglutaminase family protein [Rhizomicrobium sp.]
MKPLEFWLQPVAPRHAALLDALPDDVASLAKIPSGLVIHQHIAAAYGENISDERAQEVHIRAADDVLACVLRHDGAPLTEPRPPSKRAVGNCRHFTLLLVAMLRHKKIPARARCGFAAYFERGKYLDHWAAEVWDGSRWAMVDAQLDDVQRRLFRVPFDPLDVPRDEFPVAGDAWARCRAADLDPDAFGIMDMRGWWFIAGNVVRDIAALNNHVMLPWDMWGAMPQPGEEPDAAIFDKWAALSLDPDLDELRRAYASDAIGVPDTVFNAVRQRPERA